MKKDGRNLGVGLSIFFLCLSEVSALVFFWSMAFTYRSEPLVAIVAATFTIVISIIDGLAILVNKLNDMEFNAKHFMPDIRYKVDSIHSNVEAAKTRLTKIEYSTEKIDGISIEIDLLNRVLKENARLYSRHQEDQLQIMQLTAENNRLQLEKQKLENSLKQHSPTSPDAGHPNGSSLGFDKKHQQC